MAKFNIKKKIKNKEEARSQAIKFQNWQSEQSLYLSEVIEYQNYFKKLGKRFGLLTEFRENGII